MENDLKYEYWIMSLFKIESEKLKKIVKFFNGAKNLYFTKKIELEKSNLLSKNEIAYLLQKQKTDNLEKEFDAFLHSDIKLCVIGDEAYPKRLLDLPNSPYGLFYKGRLPSDDVLSVAVIGSRSCSYYGSYCAKHIVKELVANEIQIISGMAYGIDSLSQKTALDFGGYTAAVLGTGVNICYPKSEFSLYQRLEKMGCLISEYPPNVEGQGWHFPMRNRIISGLSDAVLVIEAREKSGTLITVDRALEQGKDVFAVPGRINDELSYSCNWLIKQGAYMATSAYDILDMLKGRFAYKAEQKNKNRTTDIIKKERIGLEREENLVYSIICFDDVCIDDIIHQVGLSLFKVSSICTKLVLKGLIREVGKGRFVRNA